MLLEISLLFIAVLCAYEYYVRHGRIGKYIKRIPGPSVLPILGSLSHFCIPRTASLEDIWKKTRMWDVKFYPIYKFWAAHHVAVVVLHPDDLEKVLTSTKNTEKSAVYNILQTWLGTGLLTSHGAKWQKRRKMLTPAFHFNVLQQYLKNIIEHAEETMKDLKSQGEVVSDVGDFVAEFTLQVICETAMGLKFNDKNSMNSYRKSVHYIGQSILYRIYKPWYWPESIFILTKKGQKYKQSLNDVHTFTVKMIKERKDFHEQANDSFLKQFVTGESHDINNDENVGCNREQT